MPPIRRVSFLISLVFQQLVFPPSRCHPHSNRNGVHAAAQDEDDYDYYYDDAPASRILQGNARTCTHLASTTTHSSTERVVDKVLAHLDSRRSHIESMVLQSYTDRHENVTVPSTQYLYADFRRSLEWMAKVGAEKGPDTHNWGGGKGLRFYMGPDNCDGDGWHVGLANVATFLGQAMSMVILNDTCDELNWEMIFPRSYSDGPDGFYPMSNACGQRGVSYTQSPPNVCEGSEEEYSCDVDPDMKITSSSKSIWEGDAPPPLQCFPRTKDQTVTGHYDPVILNPNKKGFMVNEEGNVIPSKIGRTDVEGCCWWGRGALHTRGVCNLGKLNYYLGKRAADEGRSSRYADIDFCQNPEAICSDNEPRTMDLRWTVALFEWVERVQSYNDMGWNYVEEVTKFATDEGDLVGSVLFSLGQGEPTHFVDEAGSVLEQGCPFPPCDPDRPQRLRWKARRKQNFVMAVEAVGLPVKSELFRRTEEHFVDPLIKTSFENSLLLSKSPVDGKMYESYRYHFADFMESLRKLADVGFGGVGSEEDGNFFFIGQGMEGTESSGMLNIALFLTYAIEMSILADACDEHNTQKINGRFPVSNACGMYGASYQDIICKEDAAGMECPLDINQSFSGVTRTLDHRAPQPFKCAPKSQYPVTGFWDEARLEENHKTAFTNQIGRIDVEGCCWWGRGVLRKVTQGRCFFGQLNYHLGRRAAVEGRPSLYPKIDFCEFPEAICASEHSNELRWVAGMFFWIKRLQSYDEDGWNYMEKMKALATEVASGGELDSEFLMAVDCILKTGIVDCDSAEDLTNRLNEVLILITGSDLPTQSPTATNPPSASPTESPTVPPTDIPTVDPTSTIPPSASPNIFWWPSRQDVDLIARDIEEKRGRIEPELLAPRTKINDENLYNFDDFMSALKVFADGSVQGLYFYVGHSTATNRRHRKRGLVNVAAFLAHSRTEVVYDSVCDERNMDSIDGRYALSNSCGQYGETYQNMRCDLDESFMECPPDPGLQMSAVEAVTATGTDPPPFFCGPTMYFPFTGHFDREFNEIKNDRPFANRAGRTDVQSCCWWGRGAAQVRGVCMYGKLNYYVGARAKEEGRRSLFPSVDFCKNPQAICSGQYSYSLMWVTGLFSWIDKVQSHPVYTDILDKIADGDMEYEEFIDTISDDILVSTENNKIERRSSFKLAVDAMGLG